MQVYRAWLLALRRIILRQFPELHREKKLRGGRHNGKNRVECFHTRTVENALKAEPDDLEPFWL